MLPIRLTIVTCHKCVSMRHNKRSFTWKRACDRAIPKGGNNKNITNGGHNKKAKTSAIEIGSSSHAP